MDSFLQQYDDQVTGKLSGWDRLVFRGTLRMLCFAESMMGYHSRTGVFLKDFGEHAQGDDRTFDQSLARSNRRSWQAGPIPRVAKSSQGPIRPKHHARRLH